MSSSFGGVYTQIMIRNMRRNKILVFEASPCILHKIDDGAVCPEGRQALKDFQLWKHLVFECLDAEFPDFEALQSFVLWDLSPLPGSTARARADKFCKTFHTLLPDPDDFFLQYALVRMQAMIFKEKCVDKAKQEAHYWQEALKYVDRPHLRSTSLIRTALSLDRTITGSSCGIERLFGNATQKISPQQRGHLLEETKRVYYVLLLRGPLAMGDMVRKHVAPDGSEKVLVGKFIRQAQLVWKRT